MIKEINIKNETEEIGTWRLNELLPYSMKKEIRKYVLNDGLATVEQLAVMTDIEVYKLISKKYSVFYLETSKIELIERKIIN